MKRIVRFIACLGLWSLWWMAARYAGVPRDYHKEWPLFVMTLNLCFLSFYFGCES